MSWSCLTPAKSCVLTLNSPARPFTDCLDLECLLSSPISPAQITATRPLNQYFGAQCTLNWLRTDWLTDDAVLLLLRSGGITPHHTFELYYLTVLQLTGHGEGRLTLCNTWWEICEMTTLVVMSHSVTLSHCDLSCHWGAGYISRNFAPCQSVCFS